MEATQPFQTNQNNSVNNEDMLDLAGYSPEDSAYLQSIENECSVAFPIGKVFDSVHELRETLRCGCPLAYNYSPGVHV